MSRYDILKQRLDELVKETLDMQKLILSRKIDIVNGLNLDLFSFVDGNNQSALEELKCEFKNIREFNKQRMILTKKLYLFVSDLELQKRIILSDLEEIENGEGKKRLQKKSYKNKKKNFSIPANEYALYNRLLNELNRLDDMLLCLNDLDNLAYDVNLDFVKKLSNAEKSRYFNNLAIVLLADSKDNIMDIDIDGNYIVDQDKADLFKQCLSEYKRYKNSKKTSVNKITSYIKDSLRNYKFGKKLASTSLIVAMVVGTVLNQNDTSDKVKSDESLTVTDLSNTLTSIEEEVAATLKSDFFNTNNISFKPDVGIEEIKEVTERDISLETDNILEIVGEDDAVEVALAYVTNDTESEILMSSDDILNTVFYDDIITNDNKIVDVINADNNEILTDYHLTFNNTTYDVSEYDFYRILYVIQREGNGTYEDYLTVASIVLNRVEDYRFDVTEPIQVVQIDGQFSTWDEVKANRFANNPDRYININAYEALYDALYNGIRNNDYVEFKASYSSDYTARGERKIQFVENGNKVHNLARTLDRTENEEESLNEVKTLTLSGYSN